MNVQLYAPYNPLYDTLTQLLSNRGISFDNIYDYYKADITTVAAPEFLGIDKLKEAAKILLQTISREEPSVVIIDSDCDGITSSAILINYLHRLFPTYVENHLEYIFHEGKGHGLADTIDKVKGFRLVILPDAGTNDVEYHKIIKDNCGQVICLDHHIQDIISEDAVIINNQCSDYPNKDFSGAAIVWLFCRFLDQLCRKRYADDYLDLVATGLTGDMMNLANPQTKAVIFEGFKPENIKNPFIYTTIERNQYSFNKSDYISGKGLEISPIGASFFLIPQINALCRSGTMEEKELIFKALLEFKAFEYVDSTKRGHKFGEKEQIVTQAVRMITNVKRHQDEQVEQDMKFLESMIADRGMKDHKVWVFLLQPGQVSPGVAGLAGNKLMNKYQHCVCVLTYDKESNTYRGSARGYGGSGLQSFKDICAEARGAEFTAGHHMAFGLGVSANKVDEFITDVDKALSALPDEASYFVDYIWREDNILGNRILDISQLNDYIGTGLPRSFVYITDVNVTENNSTWMKDKHLKISTPSGVDIIIWDCIDNEDKIMNSVINVVAKSNRNEWMGNISPQLIAEAYEIKKPLSAIDKWGF